MNKYGHSKSFCSKNGCFSPVLAIRCSMWSETPMTGNVVGEKWHIACIFWRRNHSVCRCYCTATYFKVKVVKYSVQEDKSKKEILEYCYYFWYYSYPHSFDCFIHVTAFCIERIITATTLMITKHTQYRFLWHLFN